MGLDGEVSEEFVDEREHFLHGFSDDKVNLKYCWLRALQFDRRPKLNFEIGISPDFENGSHTFTPGARDPQKFAIESIKNIMRVAQKVYRTSNQTQIDAYARQMRESPNFSPEDLNVCIPALTIFNKYKKSENSESNNLEKLVDLFDDDTKKMFVESNIKKIMEDFNHGRNWWTGRDNEFLGNARYFLHVLMLWMSSYVRHDTELKSEYELLSPRLNMLSRELWYGLAYGIYQDSISEHSGTTFPSVRSTQRTRPAHTLVARLNNSPKKIMANDVDCCITGPNGKHRAATALYWLDPAVYTWEFYAFSDNDGAIDGHLPFGLGIFFKAKGHHSSKKDPQEYLVLEGFPANVYRYGHINWLTEEGRETYKELQKLLPGVSWNVALPETLHSLPELIYVLGLVTAKSLGIPKLFINTEHSERTQYSVRHSLNEIMQFTGNNKMWNADAQKLMKDPLTEEGSFAAFEVQTRVYGGKKKTKKFNYTHFLKKPSFPSELIPKIAGISGKWNGEGLFDTHFPWKKFVGSAYRTWPTKEKDFDPRAWMGEHSRDYFKDKHGQLEPCWNLGIGYCRGIEVDVQDELEALKNGKELGRTSRFGANTYTSQKL